jgi:hypothetical protein
MIGRIYKITNSLSDDVYVGSTKNRLCLRWAIHKNEMKLNPNRKLEKKLREVGTANCKIELIDEMDSNDKRELLKAVEESHRKRIGANLNTYSRLNNRVPQKRTKGCY